MLYLAVSFALQVQTPVDADWVDVRFHRVHLRNGNFIDGQLAQQSPAAVTLKLKTGTMTIRMDQVDRIEFVKLRGIKEKPPEVKAPTARAAVDPSRRDPFEKPATTPAAVESSSALHEARPETKDQVDQILAEIPRADPESAGGLVEKLADLGLDARLYLASRLHELDRNTLPHAVDALLRVKDPGVVPVLAKQLAHPNPDIRSNAVNLIGALGQESHALHVHPLLRDADPAVRAFAVTAVSALGSRDSIDVLAGPCADTDREVRTRALSTLGVLAKRHDAAATQIQILRDAADQAPAEARGDIIGAVSMSGAADAPLLLARYLGDDRAEVRVAAAAGLADLGTSETATAVADRMPAETDPSVRVHLAKAAGRLKILHAGGTLIEYMGSTNRDVAAAAHQALKAIANADYGATAAGWNDWWRANDPDRR